MMDKVATVPQRKIRLTGQALLGGLALAGAGAVFLLLGHYPQWQLLWVFGLLFGFILQRGRFCFASAFRDLFLMGEARVMRGILAGLAVATPLFTIAMYLRTPTLLPGNYPPGANILPLGFHTAVAGVLFAIGMSMAGGCISGTLYRIGEGYTASIAALAGVMLGFVLLAFTWGFWWQVSVAHSPLVWFPEHLGYSGGMLLTLALIGLAFLGLVWWEHRHRPRLSWAGAAIAEGGNAPVSHGVRGEMRLLLEKVFLRPWPVMVAGAALGVLNAALFLVHHPWGVTGPLYQWMEALWRPLGVYLVPLPPLMGLDQFGGACNPALKPPTAFGLTHDAMLVLGMVAGSFISAALAGEFRVRVPRQRRRYLQSFGGGVLMGYGAALALGCTLGAFFSAIPSLALNGWLFALGLLGGSFLGASLLRRLG
ncbi:hypothetical protein HRbin23_00368 [bacterium HR23]|nr:hypothetical protein HRbin23_00368 [bacterium HR23]